ncbi:MAG: nucleotidyltransferase domain-containing protein [Holosporaceae bacterium]|jgi:predicted nucleotidyltransferase|nr:nucleotidyltransferase domain-containing protein [Holosporaceae bacterium]
MTTRGISEKQLKIIKNILQLYWKDYDFFMYGSRVNGNFSPNSDLDILVKGDIKISLDIAEKIQKEFDESDLPFIVHLMDFYDMDTSFYTSLKNNLVKI